MSYFTKQNTSVKICRPRWVVKDAKELGYHFITCQEKHVIGGASEFFCVGGRVGFKVGGAFYDSSGAHGFIYRHLNSKYPSYFVPVGCEMPYRKIPIITWLIFVQKAFLMGLIFGGTYFRRGLLLEGILPFKMDWA